MGLGVAVLAVTLAGHPASGGAGAVGRPAQLRVYSIMALEETYPGGYNEVEAGMENITTNRHVVAWITTTIIYKNRPRDRVMRWRQPIGLDPDHGFGAFILFLIPKDAPLGMATARVVVRIVRAVPFEGRSEGEREFVRIAAEDTFEVVRKADCEDCPGVPSLPTGARVRTYRVP